MIGSGLGKGIKNFRSEVKTDKKNSEKKEKIIKYLFLFWGEFFKFKKRVVSLTTFADTFDFCSSSQKHNLV